MTPRLPTNDVVIADTETSGYDEKSQHLLEVAAVRLDSWGEVVSWCDERVWPVDMTTASPQALKVNGYNEALRKRDGVPLPEALAALDLVVTKDAILVFHNSSFDLRFLPHLRNHRTLCTMSMSERQLVNTGKTKKKSLDAVCAHFQVPEPTEMRHSALGDVLRTCGVFAALHGLPPRLPELPPELRQRAPASVVPVEPRANAPADLGYGQVPTYRSNPAFRR